jgi:hypothetical protein
MEHPLVHALSVYPIASRVLRHLSAQDTTRLFQACDLPPQAAARRHMYRRIIEHYFDQMTTTTINVTASLEHMLTTESLIRQARPINFCHMLLSCDDPLTPSLQFCRECIILRDTLFDTFAETYARRENATPLHSIVAQSNRSFDTHLLRLLHQRCKHEPVNPRILGTIRVYEKSTEWLARRDQRERFCGNWARRAMDTMAERFVDVLADRVCVRVHLQPSRRPDQTLARVSVDWAGRSEMYALWLQKIPPSDEHANAHLTFDLDAASVYQLMRQDFEISRIATRPYDSNGARLLDQDIALAVVKICNPTMLRWCGGQDGVERFLASLLREAGRRHKLFDGRSFVNFYTLDHTTDNRMFIVRNAPGNLVSRNPYRCLELIFDDFVNLYPSLLIDDPDLPDDHYE